MQITDYLTTERYNLTLIKGLDSPFLDNSNLLDNFITGNLRPDSLDSGEFNGNITLVDGYLQSANFVTGVSGWQIQYDGDVEFNDGTFRGTISGATIIGGTIETSAGTGQRIVILSSDNTLTFYNSSNALVTQLGGGANVGTALRIVLDATTDKGVGITSSTVNDIGFEFVNAGSWDSTGLNIQLNHASNPGTGINIKHDGSSGECVYLNPTSGANGLTVSSASTAAAVNILTSAGESIFISHSADAKIGFEMLYAGRVEGMYLSGDDANTNKALLYATGGPSGSSVPLVEYVRTSPGNSILRIASDLTTSSNHAGIEIDMNASTTTTPHAFSFVNDCYVSAAVTGTQNRKIRVFIGGATYYIPAYDE